MILPIGISALWNLSIKKVLNGQPPKTKEELREVIICMSVAVSHTDIYQIIKTVIPKNNDLSLELTIEDYKYMAEKIVLEKENLRKKTNKLRIQHNRMKNFKNN